MQNMCVMFVKWIMQNMCVMFVKWIMQSMCVMLGNELCKVCA